MVKPIRSLDRGLQILELINARNALSLHELHVETGLPKATLLRALKTMMERKWISSESDGSTYFPGRRLQTFSNSASRKGGLAAIAGPILDELSKKVVWPSYVGTRRGGAMSVVEHALRNVRFVVNPIGRRVSFLKSSMGQTYLAFTSDVEREQILELLRSSSHPDDQLVHSKKWLQRMLEETRSRGYGVRQPRYWKVNDGFHDDIAALAVPIQVQDRVVACINILWVAESLSIDACATKYLDQLHHAARKISRGLQRQE